MFVVRLLSVVLVHALPAVSVRGLMAAAVGCMCDPPGNLDLCAAVCMSLMMLMDLCSFTGVNLSANGLSLEGGEMARSPWHPHLGSCMISTALGVPISVRDYGYGLKRSFL